jgi:hypothetical protein
MIIIRVLVPANEKEWFREKFKTATEKREWVSGDDKYIEFIFEEISIEDFEVISAHNYFWKREYALKNFYD